MALSGCAVIYPERTLGPVSKMIPPLPDNCAAEALAPLKGSNFTALADQPLPGQLRVLWPKQPVSGDLDSKRLNALVDDNGAIKRLFCG